jgi:hypothetical protein
LALAGISEHRNSPCLAFSAKTARAAADDERLFTAVVAGELTDDQFGEALCSTK